MSYPCASTTHMPTATTTTVSQMPTTFVFTSTTPEPTCNPCQWSPWYDTSFPTLGTPGGDNETYQRIREAGHKICNTPSQIQCKAEKFPNVTIDNVGQVVQCNLDKGLTCRNEDQSGPLALCFNYQVRVLCCDYTTCPPQPTTQSTTMSHTVISTSTTPSTPSTTITTTSPSTTTETTTATQPPTMSITTTSPSSTTETITTPCQETVCYFSQWISSDYPEYGPGGGDNETIRHIIQKGYKICDNPVAVECQSVHYPGVPLEKLGQRVTCNEQGLLCKNILQNPPICLNYEIKVKCCYSAPQCLTTSTTSPTTIPRTTTTTQPPTVSITNTSPSTTTETSTTQPPTTIPRTTTTTQPPTIQLLYVSNNFDSYYNYKYNTFDSYYNYKYNTFDSFYYNYNTLNHQNNYTFYHN
uniref:mucin-5AC-like n=1 Tax=Monopterus albus TaxID=43700 RepID=UPI0009B4CAA9|nr:mucin-5AC-like [Monopterus albus]